MQDIPHTVYQFACLGRAMILGTKRRRRGSETPLESDKYGVAPPIIADPPYSGVI